MNIDSNILEGIFIEESPNRFLCHVLINGNLVECYVPSSSRLENYIKLRNKKVLLIKNKKVTGRTMYSLFAVNYYNQYIMLNLNMVNKVLVEYIIRKNAKYSIFKEKIIDGYKADIVIVNKKNNNNYKVIEAKGVIGTKNTVVFPNVYSERAIYQLHKIKELLQKGISIEYHFISLSPIVKNIILNQNEKEYFQLIKECIELGMEVKGFSLKLFENNVEIYKEIKVRI